MKNQIDKDYLVRTMQRILDIPSPSGYTKKVMEEIKSMTNELGFDFEYNQKGGGIISLAGKNNTKTIAITAHVDTLGAMVRSIGSNGEIAFTEIGGPIVPTLDGEYCTIMTASGKSYRGTFLSKSPAVHVFEDSRSRKRDSKNMYIRLDALVKSKKDVLDLGINNGDFVFFDVKFEENNGFIKSRFLDDKAAVACIFSILKILKESNVKPEYNIKFIISNYEEVGHGSSYIPEDVTEMIAIDMGCIGDDLSATEQDVSICAKDSSGPYDYEMVQKLKHLCKENNILHEVDIYPFYGSDASAALRAGHNIKAALFGPGVHASHGMERTHIDALVGTSKLMLEYMLTK